MSAKIRINALDPSSIARARRDLESYKQWLNSKLDELLSKLAGMGAVNASLGFARAIYDGPKDVQVDVEQRGERTYAITASGRTVLFLEFGAGVTYGAGHPQAGEFGYGPGTYPGQTHAMNPNGWYFTDQDNGGTFSTHTWGNPPSMTMYLTAKELRDKVEEVAKEVFKS